MKNNPITLKEYNEMTLGCPTTLGKYNKLYGGKNSKSNNEKSDSKKY